MKLEFGKIVLLNSTKTLKLIAYEKFKFTTL